MGGLKLKRTVCVASVVGLAVISLSVSRARTSRSGVDCPVKVSGPSQAMEGSVIVFRASPPGYQSYRWTVSTGTISSGDRSPTIIVENVGAGSSCTATVEVQHNGCRNTDSATVNVRGFSPPRKFDEYGDIRFDDEKARLDNYAIELHNDPGADGYIVSYGICENDGRKRAERARSYLIKMRGLDASRIQVIDAGCAKSRMIQFWIVPKGASPPAGNAQYEVSPCPVCKTINPRRRPRRR